MKSTHKSPHREEMDLRLGTGKPLKCRELEELSATTLRRFSEITPLSSRINDLPAFLDIHRCKSDDASSP